MNTILAIDVIKSKEAKKRFDFLENGISIATVNYPKRFQKKAILQAGNNQWNIQRTGWWKHSIEIIAAQSPYTKWTLPQNWKGSVSIRMDDNRQFNLKKKGFWKAAWFWINEKEEVAVEIKTHSWPNKKRGSITINNKADAALLLLAQIGWFIVLSAEEDAAAAVAAGA